MGSRISGISVLAGIYGVLWVNYEVFMGNLWVISGIAGLPQFFPMDDENRVLPFLSQLQAKSRVKSHWYVFFGVTTRRVGFGV